MGLRPPAWMKRTPKPIWKRTNKGHGPGGSAIYLSRHSFGIAFHAGGSSSAWRSSGTISRSSIVSTMVTASP